MSLDPATWPTLEEQREAFDPLWAQLVTPYQPRRAAIPRQHRVYVAAGSARVETPALPARPFDYLDSIARSDLDAILATGPARSQAPIRLTLADWAKRLDPGGNVLTIVELLSLTNDVLEDLTL